MSFWSRWFSSKPEVPAWGRELGTPARCDLFVASLEQAFGAREFDVAFEDGVLYSRRVALHGGAELGMPELIARCADLPEAAWPAEIDRCFEQPFRVTSELESLRVDGFDAVRSLLRVSLFPDGPEDDGRWAGRRLADDLFAAITYDLPSVSVKANATDVIRWGRPLDEIFDLALDNVRKKEPVSVSGERSGVTKSLNVFVGAGHHAATHAMLLGEHVDVGEHGAIVTCPTRHAVLFHVIESLDVLGLVADFLLSSEAVYAQGPQSLSTSIYWVRNGRWARFPVSQRDGTTQIVAPPGFGQLVVEFASRVDAAKAVEG